VDGLLPLAAAVFLGWIIYKAMASNAANVNWTIAGIIGVGIVLMAAVRATHRGADYFATRREAHQVSERSGAHAQHSGR
jgi:hypothetical protein